ncbi:MAG TPA: hypothetical protein DCL52_04995 [Flavobacteriaceae bacterium]|nr:hypothetical protein [Flavobacteriaceae bacterium]
MELKINFMFGLQLTINFTENKHVALLIFLSLSKYQKEYALSVNIYGSNYKGNQFLISTYIV